MNQTILIRRIKLSRAGSIAPLALLIKEADFSEFFAEKFKNSAHKVFSSLFRFKRSY